MADYRPLFHVPGPGPYALTHSAGCLPRTAVDALRSRYIEPWQQRGGDAWADWLDRIDDFRKALAAMLGGAAPDWCPQTNVSAALTRLLGALPPATSGRDVWLLHEDAFPSIGFVLRALQRHGHRLRLIPRDADPGLADTWTRASTADVRGVVLTHVHSNTGRTTPAPEVARHCREHGLLCIVDVAQSAGILPWSVESMQADAVIGSCIKWLCGGPGAGFLWLRPELCAQLEPTDVGWFSHANPFEFDIHHFEPAADARRFWGGTPDVAPFVLATQSLRELQGIGVPSILAHNRELIDVFRSALPLRWRPMVRTEGHGGTLCLPAGSEAASISERLRESAVRHDRRADTLRISFHLCNDAPDAERVASAFH